MSIAEITQKHLDSVFDSAPIQYILGVASFAVFLQGYSSFGKSAPEKIFSSTFKAVFDSDSGLIVNISLGVFGVSVVLVAISAIVFKYFRKFLFFVFNMVMRGNARYDELLRIVEGANVPPDRYGELRQALKERRAAVLKKAWAGELIFFLAVILAISSFLDHRFLIYNVAFIGAIVVAEFEHHKRFVSECLPIIAILRVKFGAKDLQYPF